MLNENPAKYDINVRFISNIQTNQIMQEKEPALKNMDKIMIDSGLHQHDKTCLPKRFPFLIPVVCVQTSDTLECKSYREKCIPSLTILVKMLNVHPLFQN